MTVRFTHHARSPSQRRVSSTGIYLSEHPPTRIALRIFFLLFAGAVVNVLVAWGCARWGAHRPGEISIGAAAIAAVPPEAEKYVNDSMFRPKPDANAPPPSPITTLNPAGGPASAPSPLLTLPSQTGFPTDRNLRGGAGSGGSEDGVDPLEEMTGLEMEERRSLGCTRREYTRWRGSRVMGNMRTQASIDFGFPLRSLRYTERYSYSSLGGVEVRRIPGWKGGWPIAPSEQRQWEWTYLPPRHVYPLAVLPLGFGANSGAYAMLLGTLIFGAGFVRRRFRRGRGLCGRCGYPIGVSPVCTECGVAVERGLG